MKYADKAEQLFRSGFSCSQSVAGAFSDLVLDKISEEDLLNLASPFGGGFARKRDLCGAVSGLGIVFGLLFGTHSAEEKMKTYEAASSLTDRFLERYENIVCSNLLDLKPDFSKTPREVPLTEEEIATYHWPCIDYVRGAAQIFEAYLKENGVL